jgi:hypothetical protein
MSVKGLLLAGGVLSLAASSASAAFIIKTERTPITTGAFAGNDRVNFVVDSDTPNYSYGALAVNIATDVANGLKFRVPATSSLPPDVAPPSIDGQIYSTFNPGAKGTFAGFSADLQPLATVTEPSANTANRGLYSAGLTSIQFISAFQAPSPATTTDYPGGLVLASAVVPSGAGVTFTGNVDNDLESTNGTTAFTVVDPGTAVPEPTGLAFLGLAGAATMMRRRRQA